jgi:hypothetical protein
MRGEVRLFRPDAAHIQVTTLDATGARGEVVGTAEALKLRPECLYYLLEPAESSP